MVVKILWTSQSKDQQTNDWAFKFSSLIYMTKGLNSHHIKGAQSRLNGLKSLAKLFNFVVF